MYKKLCDFSKRAVPAFYGLLFTSILFLILFFNYSFDYNPVVQLGFIGFECIGLILFLFFFRMNREIILKHRYKLLSGVILFTFAVQMAVTMNMVQNPLYDHASVFYGRVEYATNGITDTFRPYSGYIHHYSNQRGIFLFLRGVFKIRQFFGITQYYTVSAVVGHIMFAVMITFTFLYVEELSCSDRAIFSLLLYIIFLPVYFQSSVSYTDTYSVWGIPVFLFLATKALKSAKIKTKIFYGCIAGFFMGLCMQIKVTVAISVIAFVIHTIFSGTNYKHYTSVFASCFFAILFVSIVFNRIAKNTVIEEHRKYEALPFTHWIMMGLQMDGSYSGYDEWNITGSVPGPERMAKNIEVIKERLTEMGPTGYIHLLYKKTCRTFGCGNGEMWKSYKYSKEHDNCPNMIYQLIFENGVYYRWYNNISNSVYLLFNILAVAGVLIMIIKKQQHKINYIPYLSLIGFWMFMMLWESNHRQLINQWPIYIIVAATGMYIVWEYRWGIINKKLKTIK